MEGPDLHIDVDAAPSTSFPCRRGSCAGSGGVRIYYEVYGQGGLSAVQEADAGVPKVIMIMGLACGCNGWRWQLQDLLQSHPPSFVGSRQHSCCSPADPTHPQPPSAPAAAAAVDHTTIPAAQQQQALPHQPPGCQASHLHLHQQQQHRQQPAILAPPLTVCLMDNRGIGHSEAPASKEQYSTTIMAQDVLRVMDHLGWPTAHVLGFSMGGMIATKLAAAAPERVCSLTLIATSGGGWQTVPRNWKGLRTAVRLVMARSPEEMADATLSMHFTGRTLRQWVESYRAQRRELLRREYMAGHNPPQPPTGFKGQLHACWTHRLDKADVDAIIAGGFPVLVIHGRRDALASAANAEALASRLRAPCVVLEGAHFLVRECAGQINALLAGLVLGHTHFQAIPAAAYLDPWTPAWQQQQSKQQQGKQQQEVAAAAAVTEASGSASSSSSSSSSTWAKAGLKAA